MKKLLSLLMSVIMLITFISVSAISAGAETDNSIKGTVVSETTEYFDDGTSLKIIVADTTPAQAARTTLTKTGAKYYILRNQNGAELWRFTVSGVFSVNYGVSATCTSTSHLISITEDSWQNESASTYRSGNKAIGDATFIKKLLFVTTETKSCNVVLTCDANANLS